LAIKWYLQGSVNQPHILYVDEISPDGVRATVSDKNSVFANLQCIRMASGISLRDAAGAVHGGVAVLSVGKYICMISRAEKEERPLSGAIGMVLLDLRGREEMGYAIAGRFGNVALEQRFMEVLYETSSRNEAHDLFRLVVGKSPKKLFL
jgi:hypothetical protein